MTKNYIFDFGRVLVEFEPLYMTGKYVSDEAEQKLVSEVVFDRLYWDRLDAGTISDEEVEQGIRERLPERLWKDAEMVYRNWYRHLPEIEGMRALLLRLKAEGHSLYLLSNISRGFADNYSKVLSLKALFEIFDGLVFSGPIGLLKPNAEIFEYLLDTYELQPQECTFIDDSARNIEGAKQVGIGAILFEGKSEDLMEKIFL